MTLTHAALTGVDETTPTDPVVIDLNGEATILHGDALTALRVLPDNSVDAIVTDPPYGLSKEPDIAEVLTHWLAGDDYTHTGRGFMGTSWDSFVPGPAVWREAFRVLKPGGYAAVFASSRTIDLMTISLRIAGFEVKDTLMWQYGCLTSDAEILTESGWKPGLEVANGDRVAQWDPETGKITLAAVQETFRAPWDGPMRVLRSSDTDQLLTPNHRVYHRPRKRQSQDGQRVSWFEDTWEVAEAGNLSTWNTIKLPTGGLHHGEGIGGVDYAALLGWVWTEGGFDHSGSGVRIYQSSVNLSKCEVIASLLDRVTAHKRYDRDRIYKGRTYTESTWFFTGDLAAKVRNDLPGKRPTYDLLWRMTMEEKQAFLDAAMLGDGSGVGSKSPQFHQQYEDDLIWLQTLLALIGRAGTVYMRPNRSGGHVNLRSTGVTELQGMHLKDSEEHYTGEVWCVRVPTGAFVARRSGKVFITGNSGFPKSLDLAKAFEKAGDAANAARFAGYGTALKPGHEPIALVRKPLIGTYVENVATHGTGGLNIDACRIKNTTGDGSREGEGTAQKRYTEVGGTNFAATPGPRGGAPEGRFPANVVFTHAEGCIEVGTATVQDEDTNTSEDVLVFECVDGCPVKELDAQSGIRTSGKPGTYKGTPNRSAAYGAESRKAGEAMTGFGDTGGASRFYPAFKYAKKAVSDERATVYVPSSACVEAGHSPDPHDPGTPWTVISPDPTACRDCGLAWETYQHPTVKPLSILEWLTRLLCPTGGVVLDLFAGTGTTGVTAVAEGFEPILVERDPAHVAMIHKRMTEPIQTSLFGVA